MRVVSEIFGSRKLNEKIWYDFDVSGEYVNLKSEGIKCVTSGEEQCCNDFVEGPAVSKEGKKTNVRQKRRWCFGRNKERSVREFLANAKRTLPFACGQRKMKKHLCVIRDRWRRTWWLSGWSSFVVSGKM